MCCIAFNLPTPHCTWTRCDISDIKVELFAFNLLCRVHTYTPTLGQHERLMSVVSGILPHP